MTKPEKAALLLAAALFLGAVGLTIRNESGAPEAELELFSPAPLETAAEAEEETLVNINTADLDTLCTLHGIGPALAQRIIDYREEYGFFSSPEGIIDVSGIGLATFEKFKDNITV